MAAESGLSKSTVGRIWKAFGLKPHHVDTFKLSNDQRFIDEVRDAVGPYLDPPERALVLCVDEKSRIQALDRSAPVLFGSLTELGRPDGGMTCPMRCVTPERVEEPS